MDTRASGAVRIRLVRLLGQYQSMIQGYARAITGDYQLAEDVYQEVAVILARDPGVVPDGKGAAPWLREVTRRKSLELVRRLRRMPLLSEDLLELVAGAFEPEPEEAIARLKEAMSCCLQEVGPEARHILEGRYADGLSCEDIADRVGRSVQGVYGVLKRVRSSLQRCVEQRLARAEGGL